MNDEEIEELKEINSGEVVVDKEDTEIKDETSKEETNNSTEETIIESSDNDEQTNEENEASNKEKLNNKKKSFKRTIFTIVGIIILLVVTVLITLFLTKDKKEKTTDNNSNKTEEKKLPLPELSDGERGELGIDKNINESNIDDYLNRDDAVYRDMRMLEDPANYEAIGGDRYLSGYIKGFEIVPLPYIIPVTTLPEKVGKTYQGKTLFSVDKNGVYVANYEESRKILEELFPKDKIIFLMCGGGGYGGMMRKALISLGWDENKIYNIGGYWYYEGKNKVEVKKVVDGKTIYDFDSVPYHNIDFSKLTPIKTEEKKPESTAISLTKKYYNNNLVTQLDKISYETVDEWYAVEVNKIDYKKLCEKEISNSNSNNTDSNSNNESNSNKTSNINATIEENNNNEKTCQAYEDEIAKLDTIYDKKKDEITEKKAKLLNELLASDETFIITYDEGYKCGGVAANDPRGFMFDIAYKYDIYVYDVGMSVYKKTKLYETAKYAPGVIIYSKGKIIAYTDANSKEQKKIYESEKEFKKWLTKYVKLNK